MTGLNCLLEKESNILQTVFKSYCIRIKSFVKNNQNLSQKGIWCHTKEDWCNLKAYEKIQKFEKNYLKGTEKVSKASERHKKTSRTCLKLGKKN